MKKTVTSESTFERAWSVISLATWNRPRTDSEIQSFLSRREAAIETVEL